MQPKRPRKWRDNTLSCLCAQSRAACSVQLGEVGSDPEVLLDVWVKHFSQLAKLRQDEVPGMAELQRKVQGLALESMGNEDMVLDVPFSA